jgi:hypothetical protein
VHPLGDDELHPRLVARLAASRRYIRYSRLCPFSVPNRVVFVVRAWLPEWQGITSLIVGFSSRNSIPLMMKF